MSCSRLLTNSSGFTILEVLIAMAIFSIGLLAVGALQTRSLVETGDAAKKTEAWTALEQQVDELKQMDFYADDPPTTFPADLMDNGSTWHTQNYLDNRYTVHWLVDDDNPLGTQTAAVIANVPSGTYTVCKTITVVITRAGDDPDVQSERLGAVEFIKTWAATGLPPG